MRKEVLRMEQMTYSIDEAARIIGVSKSFMYKLARNNEVPVLKLGKRLVIPKSRFIEFINK